MCGVFLGKKKTTLQQKELKRRVRALIRKISLTANVRSTLVLQVRFLHVDTPSTSNAYNPVNRMNSVTVSLDLRNLVTTVSYDIKELHILSIETYRFVFAS